MRILKFIFYMIASIIELSISFVIPIVGVILGIIFIAKDDTFTGIGCFACAIFGFFVMSNIYMNLLSHLF